MPKTQCIGQLAHRCGGIRYNNAGIGVWYTQLTVVVGGRMRVWFWRVATGRSFRVPVVTYGINLWHSFWGGALASHCRSCPASSAPGAVVPYKLLL